MFTGKWRCSRFDLAADPAHREQLHYAWVILAVTFLVVVVSAGVRATLSVLIVPLEEEFHWSRATISFALGINLLLNAAIGPFAAAVMDRLGARRTMTLAFVTTTAGVSLTPLMSQPWQLILLWGVVVGLSTGFIGAYLAAYSRTLCDINSNAPRNMNPLVRWP